MYRFSPSSHVTPDYPTIDNNREHMIQLEINHCCTQDKKKVSSDLFVKLYFNVIKHQSMPSSKYIKNDYHILSAIFLNYKWYQPYISMPMMKEHNDNFSIVHYNHDWIICSRRSEADYFSINVLISIVFHYCLILFL